MSEPPTIHPPNSPPTRFASLTISPSHARSFSSFTFQPSKRYSLRRATQMDFSYAVGSPRSKRASQTTLPSSAQLSQLDEKESTFPVDGDNDCEVDVDVAAQVSNTSSPMLAPLPTLTSPDQYTHEQLYQLYQHAHLHNQNMRQIIQDLSEKIEHEEQRIVEYKEREEEYKQRLHELNNSSATSNTNKDDTSRPPPIFISNPDPSTAAHTSSSPCSNEQCSNLHEQIHDLKQEILLLNSQLHHDNTHASSCSSPPANPITDTVHPHPPASSPPSPVHLSTSLPSPPSHAPDDKLTNNHQYNYQTILKLHEQLQEQHHLLTLSYNDIKEEKEKLLNDKRRIIHEYHTLEREKSGVTTQFQHLLGLHQTLQSSIYSYKFLLKFMTVSFYAKTFRLKKQLRIIQNLMQEYLISLYTIVLRFTYKKQVIITSHQDIVDIQSQMGYKQNKHHQKTHYKKQNLLHSTSSNSSSSSHDSDKSDRLFAPSTLRLLELASTIHVDLSRFAQPFAEVLEQLQHWRSNSEAFCQRNIELTSLLSQKAQQQKNNDLSHNQLEQQLLQQSYENKQFKSQNDVLNKELVHLQHESNARIRETQRIERENSHRKQQQLQALESKCHTLRSQIQELQSRHFEITNAVKNMSAQYETLKYNTLLLQSQSHSSLPTATATTSALPSPPTTAPAAQLLPLLHATPSSPPLMQSPVTSPSPPPFIFNHFPSAPGTASTTMHPFMYPVAPFPPAHVLPHSHSSASGSPIASPRMITPTISSASSPLAQIRAYQAAWLDVQSPHNHDAQSHAQAQGQGQGQARTRPHTQHSSTKALRTSSALLPFLNVASSPTSSPSTISSQAHRRSLRYDDEDEHDPLIIRKDDDERLKQFSPVARNATKATSTMRRTAM